MAYQIARGGTIFGRNDVVNTSSLGSAVGFLEIGDRATPPEELIGQLRPWEAEIARLWDEGLSSVEIARDLHLTRGTVEKIIKLVVDDRDPDDRDHAHCKQRIREQSAALLNKLREVFPQYCGAPADERHHAA